MILCRAYAKASARWPAYLHCLETATLDAAADVKYDLTQCRAHRNLDKSRVINITRQRERFGSVVVLRSEAFIPFRTSIDNRRNITICLNIIKYCRFVKKSMFNRSRRLNSRHTSVAFNGCRKSTALAAYKRTGAFAYMHIKIKSGAHYILTKQSVFHRLVYGLLKSLTGKRVFGTHIYVTMV